MEVVRIVNEPTAASMAYGLDKQTQDMKILVFDLGGGTLDVTIMEFGGGVFQYYRHPVIHNWVEPTWTKAMIEYLTSEFKKQKELIYPGQDCDAEKREGAEKAKIELSTIFETEINLPFITATNDE